jgi:hypothetical protein
MQYYIRSESIGRRLAVGWGLIALALVAHHQSTVHKQRERGQR